MKKNGWYVCKNTKTAHWFDHQNEVTLCGIASLITRFDTDPFQVLENFCSICLSARPIKKSDVATQHHTEKNLFGRG